MTALDPLPIRAAFFVRYGIEPQDAPELWEAFRDGWVMGYETGEVEANESWQRRIWQGIKRSRVRDLIGKI